MKKMKVEILEVAGIIPAMQALRLPYSLPTRSKVYAAPVDECIVDMDDHYERVARHTEHINKEDIKLLSKLIKGGDEVGKCVRGVIAYLRIEAPLYFWNEMVTYKVGCECLSSTSTMHTITKGVEAEMFDCDYAEANALADFMQIQIDHYNKQTDKDAKEAAFLNIKQQLPMCFIQTRILAISYQTLRRICHQRRNHRLPEWHEFIDAIAKLPFANELILC